MAAVGCLEGCDDYRFAGIEVLCDDEAATIGHKRSAALFYKTCPVTQTFKIHISSKEVLPVRKGVVICM